VNGDPPSTTYHFKGTIRPEHILPIIPRPPGDFDYYKIDGDNIVITGHIEGQMSTQNPVYPDLVVQVAGVHHDPATRPLVIPIAQFNQDASPATPSPHSGYQPTGDPRFFGGYSQQGYSEEPAPSDVIPRAIPQFSIPHTDALVEAGNAYPQNYYQYMAPDYPNL
jgi:hypothetical protein